jgi:flavodoxin
MIVYDSFFGNTEQIAHVIGNIYSSQDNVETIRVTKVKPGELIGLRLLIVGSPTRGFRPTEAITKFLKQISDNRLKGVMVAAFDTRLSLSDIESSAVRTIVRVGGYAANSIANKLRKNGGTLIVPPEGFLVTGEKGPLKVGELQRAEDWAKQLFIAQ